LERNPTLAHWSRNLATNHIHFVEERDWWDHWEEIGEEKDSGEVVMLGRRGGDVSCLPQAVSQGRFLSPLLGSQLSALDADFVFIHPQARGCTWLYLLHFRHSFQTRTSLDSGVVLDFESTRSNLVDYVMLYT
jgi:hypothetical protein